MKKAMTYSDLHLHPELEVFLRENKCIAAFKINVLVEIRLIQTDTVMSDGVKERLIRYTLTPIRKGDDDLFITAFEWDSKISRKSEEFWFEMHNKWKKYKES